jgi:hypothetical protein
MCIWRAQNDRWITNSAISASDRTVSEINVKANSQSFIALIDKLQQIELLTNIEQRSI